MRYLKDGLAGTICLSAVGWALDLPRALGLILFVQQYMLFVLALVLIVPTTTLTVLVPTLPTPMAVPSVLMAALAVLAVAIAPD